MNRNKHAGPTGHLHFRPGKSIHSKVTNHEAMVKGVDYIGVGVGAMVFNAKGEVFLAKRGPAARNERSHWEFPGGAVHLHERLRDAIQREFVEEYGMIIEPHELFCVRDHILRKENQHWVSMCYIATHISGTPKILEVEKCLEIRWCHLIELPSPLTLISTNYLRGYSSAYGKGQRLKSRHVHYITNDNGLADTIRKHLKVKS